MKQKIIGIIFLLFICLDLKADGTIGQKINTFPTTTTNDFGGYVIVRGGTGTPITWGINFLQSSGSFNSRMYANDAGALVIEDASSSPLISWAPNGTGNVTSDAAGWFFTGVRGVGVTNNLYSRGSGVVVSPLGSTTNSIIQVVSGTYGGVPTNITWQTAFAATPKIIGIVHTDSNGTTLLNDSFWTTNTTTTGTTVGARTAAGIDSAATMNFNVTALGKQ